MDKETEEWKKRRKREFKIIFLRLPLVLLILVAAITSVSLFIDLLGLCAISYYWIEVGEDLKENNVLTKRILIILSVTGGIYFIASFIAMLFSSTYLWIFVGISTCGYTFFKIYRLVVLGFKKKKIKAISGLLIGLLGLFLGLSTWLVNVIVFGVTAACSFFGYVIFDDITRFKVEREGHKREI